MWGCLSISPTVRQTCVSSHSRRNDTYFIYVNHARKTNYIYIGTLLGALVLEGIEEEELGGGVHRHLSCGGRGALPAAGRALPRAGAGGAGAAVMAVTRQLQPHGKELGV